MNFLIPELIRAISYAVIDPVRSSCATDHGAPDAL